VVDVEREPWPLPSSRPLQHLQVAVGVAKRGQRSPTELLVDRNRLALLVVEEIELGQADKHRLAVTHLVLDLDAATDHLFGRDIL
jgi:hypothetical protein